MFDSAVALGFYPLLGPMFINSMEKTVTRLADYEPLEPVQVEGASLRIIGVAHTRETFDAHRDDIRRRVQQAPFVFLEYFKSRMRKLARLNMSIEQKNTNHDDNRPAVQFFSGVGRICAEEQKDIVVVNPDENDLLGNLELGMALGYPASLLLESSVKSLATLFGKRMSRRTVSSYLGIGASALVLSSLTGGTRELRSMLQEQGILPSTMAEIELANILGWSLVDYRDLRSADGIERTISSFAHELSSEVEIPMLEGGGHNGKIEYLRDPELRKAKKAVYPHYNLVDINTVRRYTYNPVDNAWTLKQEIPY